MRSRCAKLWTDLSGTAGSLKSTLPLLGSLRSYEAFYDLKFQLAAGELERDYTVLAHGHYPVRNEISHGIAWLSQGPEANEASVVRPGGRSSKTLLRALRVARRPGKQYGLWPGRVGARGSWWTPASLKSLLYKMSI